MITLGLTVRQPIDGPKDDTDRDKQAWIGSLYDIHENPLR